MREIDITNKIKIIEQLKSQLLTDVSSIYSNMAADEGENKNNIELLADIIIISYFLSEKLGTSYEALDIRIKNKLKLAIINEEEQSRWKTQLSLLARHFDL